MTEDPLERLVETFGESVDSAKLDCGPGRWSDDAMSLYDRLSGMTWEKIADRRNRSMIYWDNNEVYVLEYPGGVEIPIWDPGTDFFETQDFDPQRAARAIRRALKLALKEICAQRPELAVPISRINREYLTTREPVPMCFPTAKEWTRPESERR